MRLLSHAAAAVTHGGNNSVTEAMTEGVPLVVLPFSTDQFAGAEALERVGAGVVLPPVTATVDDVADALARVLDLPTDAREALVALSRSLRQQPGRLRALAAVDAALPPRA